MAELVVRAWQPSDTSGLPRRDRRGCEYHAYIPDPLVGRELLLSGTTAADVTDAEAMIARLNADVSSLADTEALARLLLRAEAVASSHIEGLQIGGRRLLRAEAAGALGERTTDVSASEVLGNIAAMDFAVRHLRDEPLTPDGILEMHRLLLTDTDRHPWAGAWRTEQNWIGGSSYNPCAATFVPPPVEHVVPLMEDLCAFVDDDSLPAVAQAAIAHAQFETIHPFVDGNGRVGRALVHVVLRRRGLAPRAVPPISLVLATRIADYLDGLTAYQYVGPPDDPAAVTGIDRWVATFAAATARAAADAQVFEQRIDALGADWRRRLGRVRADSAAAELLTRLPGMPVVTVNTVVEALGRSFSAVNQAVDRLVDADILRPITSGNRNRAFEATEVIDAFTDLERSLASPAGDTRAASPARVVPAPPSPRSLR